MENKKNPNKIFGIILKILLTISAIVYVILVIEELTHPIYNSVLGAIMIVLMFLFFLVGYLFLYKDEKISGWIFMVWYGILWVLALWVWSDAGMVLLFGTIIPILGAIILIKAYFKKIKTLILKWKN